MTCGLPVRCGARRGAVMSETVLVLPLVFVLLALMFFLGATMTRLYRASAIDRYESRRLTTQAPGPATGLGMLNGHARVNVSSHLTEALNREFFIGTADVIDGEVATGTPALVRTAMIDVAGMDASSAGDAAAELAADVLDRRPIGLQANFRVEETLSNAWMATLDSPVRHGHQAAHHPWPYAPRVAYREQRAVWRHAATPIVTHTDEVVETFLGNLDDALSSFDASGNPLADPLRDAYRHTPSYDTPELPPWWWVP